jgi:hypothetical protein
MDSLFLIDLSANKGKTGDEGKKPDKDAAKRTNPAEAGSAMGMNQDTG